MHTHFFDHETLDAYRLLAEVARWYLTAGFPGGPARLTTPGRVAAQTAAINGA